MADNSFSSPGHPADDLNASVSRIQQSQNQHSVNVHPSLRLSPSQFDSCVPSAEPPRASETVVACTNESSHQPHAQINVAANSSIPNLEFPPQTVNGLAVPTIGVGEDDGMDEWIDRTNEPLGEIGNGYDLTPTLQSLCLTNNRIKKIERLEPCVKLTELILRQNAITVVEGLDTLQNLVELDLYMNAVTDIPPSSFKNNPKLKRLDLSFNQLRTLDKFPSQNLQNLEELYLIGNKIRKISGLGNMPKLVMLELGDNRLRDILNLEQLSTLQSLWLGRNKIASIRNLEPLCDLRKLSLQSNRITVIEGLAHLTHLEELYLSHNGLKSMHGVHELKSLRLLDLGANEIERVEGVDQLRLLKEFWFNNNKLATFDDLHLLRDSTEIETVYLEGNPVAKDPEYQKKVLNILPDSLDQLDALLVVDVREELARTAVTTSTKNDAEVASN